MWIFCRLYDASGYKNSFFFQLVNGNMYHSSYVFVLNIFLILWQTTTTKKNHTKSDLEINDALSLKSDFSLLSLLVRKVLLYNIALRSRFLRLKLSNFGGNLS